MVLIKILIEVVWFYSIIKVVLIKVMWLYSIIKMVLINVMYSIILVVLVDIAEVKDLNVQCRF